MTQPALAFDQPSSVEPVTVRPRFISCTSRKAYDELQPTLQGRELFVIGELLAYEREHGRQPTGYELFVYARDRWPDHNLDLNSVRPRLADLSHNKFRNGKPKRVLVSKVEQRTCAVTGKTAWTWKVL